MDESDWQAQPAKTSRSLNLQINTFSFFLIQTIFNTDKEENVADLNIISFCTYYLYFSGNVREGVSIVGREECWQPASVICCMCWNQLNALD